MADRPKHPLHYLRNAIPHPQFFLTVFLGSFLLQYLISGLRVEHPDLDAAISGSIRSLPSSALLVTAHPDDEAMFFAPAVQGLAAAGTVLSALCLSTGNAAGLGHQRAEELYASYGQLGVSASRVKYLDDARLQDSMDATWPTQHISSVVGKHINSLKRSSPIDALITFDKHGISGHLNHIAAYNGTRDLAVARNLPLYVLPSMEVWEKYNSAPLAVFETFMYSGRPVPAQDSANYKPASEILILASTQQYINGIRAMLKHKTQLEWFRYLYLVFSRYMFSNRLVLWTPELDADVEA
ncbi:N-acetylglucosaminyl phosphatidylinositol deacetylase-related [Kalmanozyma brasiliensis GHG001]|uniref:N-acetylglucosaminylphosphatidylinositol deacetylase n=1 Tax=Kalmanozyma brasiliensis (strain GHG001) TaxID=1365824 RepID=V5EH67_KALBG|nr:N-acetylglucosaminyl phosphatidylinositol deacetylase-related [Kalmanozyma brasiliensis GHG001]EST09921.1 N-acetylglucosaminyl phosphatidylinositol deacetylase-related [Kalmanozyma brasiliensis GHG001]